MSGYKKDAREAAIPPDVSGHAAGGAPLTEPHLAIAPLAFLGARYADGHAFGFALIPPGNGDLLASQDFQDAIRTIAPWNDKEGRRGGLIEACRECPLANSIAVALFRGLTAAASLKQDADADDVQLAHASSPCEGRPRRQKPGCWINPQMAPRVSEPGRRKGVRA